MKLLSKQSVLLFFLICISINVFGQRNREETLRIDRLPDLSVSQGELGAEGVSAAYAGMLGQRLIVAGGCNFPDTPAADGGHKKYYRDIYLLEDPIGKPAAWRKVGELPKAAAYGVSVTVGDGIICAGGRNNTERLTDVWRLSWDSKADTVRIETLPPLPVAIDNGCGAVYHKLLYIAGGFADAAEQCKAFVLHLDKLNAPGAWEPLPDFPGQPRIQPVGIIQNCAEEVCFFVVGGYSPAHEDVRAQAHSNALYYSQRERQWHVTADITNRQGEPQAFVGAVGFPSGSHHLALLGGVNKAIFERELNRPYLLAEALAAGDTATVRNLQDESAHYMRHPPTWYHFNNQLFFYHTITDTWSLGQSAPCLAKAGAAAVPYKDRWLLVCGESKPGVRSHEVYAVTLQNNTFFGWLNWTVLLLYLLSMLLIGWFFMHRSKSSNDYFRGGGRIPWWAAGISIYATMLSAITYMAIPAKAYATNWCYYPMQLMIFFVAFPVIRYYLPFFRRLNVTSAYEYLEKRFNYATRFMASWLFIIFMVARSALVLFLPSLALSTVTGIDIYTCIILMGVITIIYCTMGGVEAVVWGDVIQGIILVGGAIIAALYLIFHTDGGASGFVNIALSDGKLQMFEWSLDGTKAVFWVVLLGGFANNLISYTSDQTVIQRYLTTKDEKSAGRSILMNGIMSALISIVFYTIGTGLYTFFKSHPAEMSHTLTNGDAIFPYFMMSQLPAGVAGLLIAAIFAATMSTIGSNINSTATAFTVDICQHFRPQMNDRRLLLTARYSSLFFGSVGIGLALLMATWNILSLFDYFNTILGLLTSGLGGLFIMGIFSKNIDSVGAFTGFLTGTLSVILLSAFTDLSFLLFGAIGIIISVGIAFIISLFIRNKKDLAGLTWRTLKSSE